MTNACNCHNCVTDSNRTPQKKLGLLINSMLRDGTDPLLIKDIVNNVLSNHQNPIKLSEP